jgi:hypothetical protein
MVYDQLDWDLKYTPHDKEKCTKNQEGKRRRITNTLTS